MMGEVRFQKECVVAQRFPATGKCPVLKAAGGMGVTGVFRNGKWGPLERAAPMEEMALGIYIYMEREQEVLAFPSCLPSHFLPSIAQPYVETIWQESLEMSFPLKTCKQDKVCREWI